MARALLVVVGMAAVVLPASLAGSRPAVAAVRICRETIVAEPEQARTEIEARRLALQRWTVLAGLHGTGFSSWRLAANKSIACRLLGDGLHHCQARGAPCTISQTMPPIGPRTPAPGPSEPAPPAQRPAAPKDGVRI